MWFLTSFSLSINITVYIKNYFIVCFSAIIDFSLSLFFSVEPGWQRVVQVDLEVDGGGSAVGSRSFSWAVEYPGIRPGMEETETHIHLAQKDLVGIVPLAMVRTTSFQWSLREAMGLCRSCWDGKIKRGRRSCF